MPNRRKERPVISEGPPALSTPGWDRPRRPTLPLFETFSDAGAYYATRAHEMIHRTGHETRLARSLANRFGSAAHAVEEPIAELGAAFTCATIGISPTPRPDQASYLAVTRDGRRRRRRGRAMATSAVSESTIGSSRLGHGLGGRARQAARCRVRRAR